jgi:hypothetical protein
MGGLRDVEARLSGSAEIVVTSQDDEYLLTAVIRHVTIMSLKVIGRKP